MHSVLIRLGMLVTSAGLLQSSCVSVGPGGSSGGDGSADSVTVKFVNASTAALDPQFYATGEDLGDPNETLFQPQNQITQGYGFAGTGLIPGGQTSPPITIPCDQARSLGTLGGAFKNPSTGDLLGTGSKRALSIDYAYLCGDSIVFTFRTNPSFSNSFIVE